MAEVRPPDLEAFLTRYLREGGLGVAYIGNKEPAGEAFPSSAVVVLDNGGPQQSRLTFERNVNVSVLAGTRQLDHPANELASRVYARLTDDRIVTVPGSPIAAVTLEGCYGPYPVQESQDRARRLLIVQYVAFGSWA